jgi:uncharacterized membrane protein
MVAGLAIISYRNSGPQQTDSWSKIDATFPIAAGAAYGISHVFRKVGLNINHDPMMGVVVQNTIALTFSLVLAFLKKNRRQMLGIDRRAWIPFGLSGVFSVLGQMSLFQALELGSVVIVSPLSAVSPLFVIVMARIFLKKIEHVTWKIVVGAVLIVLGTIFLTLFPHL